MNKSVAGLLIASVVAILLQVALAQVQRDPRLLYFSTYATRTLLPKSYFSITILPTTGFKYEFSCANARCNAYLFSSSLDFQKWLLTGNMSSVSLNPDGTALNVDYFYVPSVGIYQTTNLAIFNPSNDTTATITYNFNSNYNYNGSNGIVGWIVFGVIFGLCFAIFLVGCCVSIIVSIVMQSPMPVLIYLGWCVLCFTLCSN